MSANYAKLGNNASESRPDWFGVWLFALSLALRMPFVSDLYFGDGPNHLKSILNHSYVIQPPGYWLFARTAGLFPDPVMAISVMNVLFGAFGAVAFYLLAKLMLDEWRARAASVLYGTIFYVWFASEVHSTYASQVLFPPLIVYCLMRSNAGGQKWLYAAAAALALGAGFRPTDGLFMVPLFVCYLTKEVRVAAFMSVFAIFGGLCLGWILPTMAAYRNAGGITHVAKYVESITTVRSIAGGLTTVTFGNVVRATLPVVAALWLVLGGILHRPDKVDVLLYLWCVPAFLFFCLVYMGFASYLDCITGGLVLLCARHVSARRLALAAVWNTVLCTSVPAIPSSSLPVKVLNHYVLRFTIPETRFHHMLNLADDLHWKY